MVLKELSAFLGMSDSQGHVSPSLCVCKVSFNIFTLCAELKSIFQRSERLGKGNQF